MYISQELINEKTLKEAISRTIIIKISDIKDFLVLPLSSSAFKTRLLPEVQHQSSQSNSLNSVEKIEVTYNIQISNSSYNTSYYISGLKSSLHSGQFIDNVHFYSRQNNISVFKDMVFFSFDFSSVVPSTYSASVVPTQVVSAQPTQVVSAQPTHIVSAQPTHIASAQPTHVALVLPTQVVSPSLNPTVAPSSAPSIVPTIAPSSLPSVVPTVNPSTVPTASPSVCPSRNPTTHLSVTPSISSTSRSPTSRRPTVTRTVVPSIKPGDPTLTPTCKIYLIDYIKRLILLLIFTL